MKNQRLMQAALASLLAVLGEGAWAHAGAGTVLENITIGPSLTALGEVLYADGDYLVPHMTLYNQSGQTWIGMQVEILTWNPNSSAYENSPAGDAISFGQYTTSSAADWATQGGAAGLHVKLNGIYQCNGVDAASTCTGNTGQVMNPGSWSWTRDLNPDTYTVMFDPNKLVALDGQNLHIGGYEIEYGSQTENFRLRFTAITAVPEADAWALMLAGLGLVGWVARRRHA
jgi:hypothetical protein